MTPLPRMFQVYRETVALLAFVVEVAVFVGLLVWAGTAPAEAPAPPVGAAHWGRP